MAADRETTTERIDIVVGGWRLGMKFLCRACGKGKFTADQREQVCPKCGQAHQVKVQM